MDVVKSILENDSKKKDSSKSTEVHKDVELDIDLGTLLASDYNTLDAKALRESKDLYLKSLTRDNVQLLINKIWELPVERVDEVIVATLPKPTYVLPRSRAIPKPKPLTKWEKFAKEKGIRTKKKNKLKWDEELKKWIPTYGYKRAKAEKEKTWLIEAKEGDDVNKNSFTEAKTEKKERQSKNELKRLHNIAKSNNIKLPKLGVLTTQNFTSSQNLSEALTIARVSTASVGKFQSKLPKEKDAKGIAKEVPGMKKKRKAPPLNVVEEKRANKGLVDKILTSNTKILRDDYPTITAKRKAQSVAGDNKKKKASGKHKKGTRGRKSKTMRKERNKMFHKKFAGNKRK
ncbi:hypothetical protein P5V15_005985 [Pogonomyrmex californicus]